MAEESWWDKARGMFNFGGDKDDKDGYASEFYRALAAQSVMGLTNTKKTSHQSPARYGASFSQPNLLTMAPWAKPMAPNPGLTYMLPLQEEERYSGLS